MRARKLAAAVLFAMGIFILFVWMFLLSLFLSGSPSGQFTLADAASAVLPVLLGIDAVAAGAYVRKGKNIKNLMLFGIIIVAALFVALLV